MKIPTTFTQIIINDGDFNIQKVRNALILFQFFFKNIINVKIFMSYMTAFRLKTFFVIVRF